MLGMLSMFISLNCPAASKVGLIKESEAQNGRVTCLISIDNKRWKLNENICLSEFKIHIVSTLLLLFHYERTEVADKTYKMGNCLVRKEKIYLSPETREVAFMFS